MIHETVLLSWNCHWIFVSSLFEIGDLKIGHVAPVDFISHCGLMTTSICFFVDLIITNILGLINLFWLLGPNEHRWSIMVSVHYGLKRSTPTYVNVFTLRLHMDNMNWHCYVSICQNVEGPCQLTCQCLTASRSESHSRKNWRKHLFGWISTTVEEAATAKS